ncbi:MAG TPA: YicC family protein [Clostridiales bacterium]|nr:YicC family protein [Clostridiales bacterium]
MIRSMTGFGRCESTSELMNISIEVKSVNHRYFEFNARVPRIYSFLEEKLKNLFQSKLSRGKIEVFLTINTDMATKSAVEVNYQLAESYINALRSIAEKYNIIDDISTSSIMRISDIFNIVSEPIDEEAIWNEVRPVAEKAVENLIAMKESEGAKLFDDISSRVESILKMVEFIEQRSEITVKLYRERLEQKIRELIGDVQVDEQRLLTETAIFADKIAVSEETVRIRSHLNQFAQLLKSDGAVGRKLDFIVQELNREANTIGSKTQDVEIAHVVVEIKSEIEKIREQVQNIE